MKNRKFGNLKLLLVDDDPFFLRLTTQVLSGLGLRDISTASDGLHALELLKSGKFDLLLTDVQMPVMNGLELLKYIRTGKAGIDRGLITIIFTSFSDMSTLTTAIKLDVNGFLVKPYKAEKVMASLRRAMSEKNSKLSPASNYTDIDTGLDSFEASRMSAPPVAEQKEVTATPSGRPVALAELEPLMQLAQDVVSSSGTVLMSANSVLNERTINRLQDLRSILNSDKIYIQQPG